MCSTCRSPRTHNAMYQTVSALLIATLTLVATTWTAIATAHSGMGASISAVLRTWGQEWAVLPYLWGVLFSHFWLGHQQAMTTPKGDLWITLGSMVLMGGLSAALRGWGVRLPQWAHLVLLAAGMAVGHYFWSQA